MFQFRSALFFCGPLHSEGPGTAREPRGIQKVCPAQLETNPRGEGHPQRDALSSQREGEGDTEV